MNKETRRICISAYLAVAMSFLVMIGNYFTDVIQVTQAQPLSDEQIQLATAESAKLQESEIIQSLSLQIATAHPTSTPTPTLTAIPNKESKVPDRVNDFPSWYEGDDGYLLAQIMYHENNCGSDTLLLLTGSVVLNRVQSKDYPNTIREVWLDTNHGKQYSTSAHCDDGSEIPERVTQLAEQLLRDGPTCPPDVVYQAMFKQGDYVYYSEKQGSGTEYICGER